MFIHSNDQLKKFYLKCQKHEIIAVDTEFHRVDSYYPKLCLIQLANLDDVILIDPLKKKINLEILGELFDEKKILKIFHAASQDLEIFYNLFKRIPENIIDTQICINLLGFSNSLGYADSIKLFLEKKIDKSQQFIDWRKRPLSKEKLLYAMNDVKHLIPLYKKVLKQIKDKKLDSFLKKFHKNLNDKNNYLKKPTLAWEKLKINKPTNLRIKILKEICKKREIIAKNENIPVKRLIKDQQIKFISNKKTKIDQILVVIDSLKNRSLRKELKLIFNG